MYLPTNATVIYTSYHPPFLFGNGSYEVVCKSDSGKIFSERLSVYFVEAREVKKGTRLHFENEEVSLI